MTLLALLYQKLTAKTIAESERKRKVEEKKILGRYRESSKNKHRSKWDYSIMQKSMKRNNEQHELTLERKLAKWNWLKRLI